MRSVIVIAALLLGAAPIHAAECDPIAFAQRLTTELYLKPLGIESATLRVEVDRFELDAQPNGFLVHVYDSNARGAKEILTVDIVRIRGFLQYVFANGPAVENAKAGPEKRQARREVAARVLKELGGYDTDGKRYVDLPGRTKIYFKHPSMPAYMLGDTSSASFDDRTGFLRMLGVPCIPPGE